MPEQLDLSEVLHNPGMRLPFDVNVVDTSELEMDCTEPVTGRIVLTNTGNLLVVQGTVAASLRTVCPRCLAEVVTALDVEVDDEFTVEHCLVTGRADEDGGMADPATAALWTEERILNLTELVRQSIVLAALVEPLCREDCKGLCPHCGANRNEAECDCRPEGDSPFAALAGLYKEGPE